MIASQEAGCRRRPIRDAEGTLPAPVSQIADGVARPPMRMRVESVDERPLGRATALRFRPGVLGAAFADDEVVMLGAGVSGVVCTTFAYFRSLRSLFRAGQGIGRGAES